MGTITQTIEDPRIGARITGLSRRLLRMRKAMMLTREEAAAIWDRLDHARFNLAIGALTEANSYAHDVSCALDRVR